MHLAKFIISNSLNSELPQQAEDEVDHEPHMYSGCPNLSSSLFYIFIVYVYAMYLYILYIFISHLRMNLV